MTMPTFRSTAETAQASGGTLTITKPAGTVDGDFLLAFIVHGDTSSGAITPPAGWTALFDDVALNDGTTLSMYRKIAASEGANYAFTVSDSAQETVGHITCWQDVDPTIPISDLVYTKEANNPAGVVPTAWAAYANSVAITFMGAGNAVDATPSGYTQREKTTQGAVTAEIATCSKNVAAAGYVGSGFTGASGNQLSGMLVLHGVGETLSGGPAVAGWRHVGDGTSSTVLDRPYGTADGDLLLLVAFDSTAHSTFTLGGSGWASLQDQAFHGSFAAHQSWWKVAASEPATYTHSWTSGTNDVEWFLVRIVGASATSPIAGSQKATATGSTSLSFPSIASVQDNALLLILAMDEAATAPAWTPPSGFSEQIDAQALMDATDVLGVFTGRQSGAGATGTITATGTGTGSGDDKVGLLVAITPANTPPTAPTWVTPSGAYSVDASLALALTNNDPDPGDTISSYALQRDIGGTVRYLRASDSTWQVAEQKNTGSGLTTQSILLAAGWGLDGDATHQYTAKTWDAADAEGEYGPALLIIPSAANDPTIDTPADGGTVATTAVTPTWTVAQQSEYLLELLDAAGTSVLWSSGWTASVGARSATVGYLLDNGTSYKVRLTTKNYEGLASTAVVVSFTTSFTEPATPIVDADGTTNPRRVRISIVNPTPSGAQPDLDENRVWRRPYGDTTTGIRRKVGVADSGTWDEWYVGSGQLWEFRVEAVGVNGASAFSEWVPATAEVLVWLDGGEFGDGAFSTFSAGTFGTTADETYDAGAFT